MRTFLLLAAIACTTLLVAACGDNKVDRDQFIQDSQDKIQALQDDLAGLQDRITSGDAGDEANQQAEELKQRINDAQDRLDEIRAANDDEWQDLKRSLDDTLNDAGDIAANIRDRLGID